MFKNMGGNIPGGNFLGGSFPDTVKIVAFSTKVCPRFSKKFLVLI